MGAHINRDASTRESLDALRRIVQALRESSRRAEQRLGVSGAQLFVLEQLAENPSQSLNDLAARTCTHQSSVSTVVARLVAQRLVSCRRSAADGRRLELVLTPRGRRLAARTTGAAQGRLLAAIEHLAPPSRRRLAGLLRQVVNGMDAVEQPPRMFFDDHRQRTPHRND